MKKIYKFDNNGNTFVLNDPRPPKEWVNYLWSEEGYICRVNHNGAGDSTYINEQADLCELNNQSARYFYLRDEKTRSCWNVGEGPLMESVDHYCCQHHISHTTIQSKKNEIQADLRVFVPFHGYEEVWTLKLKNTGKTSRLLSLFSATSFSLEGFDYPRYHEMFRTLESAPDVDLNGVFCQSAHQWAPHNRYHAYIASSEKMFAAESNLLKFTGTNGSFARPERLLDGLDLTNSKRACYDLGGIIQNKIELAAGEEKAIHVIIGLTTTLENAKQTVMHFFTGDAIEKDLLSTTKAIHEKYGTLHVKTPDEQINHVMNNWLKKQVDFCIVGKKGVRDNAQIASAMLMYRPERAKAEILEILSHQYQSGNAVLTWLPLDETRYSDQPFWIIWSVIELIKETGEFDVLDQTIKFQDGGEATVFEHLKRAVQRLLDDRGANGLVKIFFADWNDALNVTDDPDAESVMLTIQLCLALKEFAELCDRIEADEYAGFLREKYQDVKKAVNAKAWDGEWYARVLSKEGNIGSKDSDGSQIYLNPQIWGVLAGVADGDRLADVLKAVDSMEHDFGFAINKPPYSKYSPHVGRMGLMLYGLYENGGVYCHASAFKIMMDCATGRGAQALRTLKKIMPDHELNPCSQSETEPFVFTNCYAIHPNSYGKADRSWITGTSAWCLKGLMEGILGVQKEYEGLRIEPCLPPDWDKVEVSRTFRGTRYQIQISNQAGSSDGDIKIRVDGTSIDGTILPLFQDDEIHFVDVVI